MTTDDLNHQSKQTADLLKKSKRLLVITGAGISADSGLPTYRGISGLYNTQKTEEGMPIEVALSGSTFKKNPHLTWKYISQIEHACRGKTYNRGHEIIAEMEAYFDRVCVLTQNIDGFHHKAGSTNVIDIHGDLHNLYCTRCTYKERVVDFSHLEIPPHCPKCDSILRPDVVLFEEMLSTTKTRRLLEETEKGFDLVFTIGTTSVFPYIAQPVVLANHYKIPSVEINPSSTSVSEMVTIKINDTAAKSLDKIWKTYLE